MNSSRWLNGIYFKFYVLCVFFFNPQPNLLHKKNGCPRPPLKNHLILCLSIFGDYLNSSRRRIEQLGHLDFPSFSVVNHVTGLQFLHLQEEGLEFTIPKALLALKCRAFVGSSYCIAGRRRWIMYIDFLLLVLGCK